MLNIELYSKQLNGEINIKEITNPPPPPKPDVQVDCYIYKMIGNRSRMLSASNSKRPKPCNVTLIFNGNTGELKDLYLINKNENI